MNYNQVRVGREGGMSRRKREIGGIKKKENKQIITPELEIKQNKYVIVKCQCQRQMSSLNVKVIC